MHASDGTVLLAPTDLTSYLACEHLTALELASVSNRLTRPEPREDAELLAQKGLVHESGHLEHLRREGREIRDISTDRGFQVAADETRTAINTGVDVIYQGVLDRWPLARDSRLPRTH